MRSTQKAAIRAALKCGQRLTPKDALRQFGCFRLAARIADLRREGLSIKSQRLTSPKGQRFAEYWMARA